MADHPPNPPEAPTPAADVLADRDSLADAGTPGHPTCRPMRAKLFALRARDLQLLVRPEVLRARRGELPDLRAARGPVP